MKHKIKKLVGFTLKETDGEIGTVEEFYFDDENWTIRYLIVKTGNWLSGRKVLISPQAIHDPDWSNEEFPVNLTKEQIENSPDIDTDEPVSKQQEKLLYSHYAWGPFPNPHGGATFGTVPGTLYGQDAESSELDAKAKADLANMDQHLRSTDKIMGYSINALDGKIGKVSDYIVDDQTWEIKFFVVETGTWLNNNKVLLSTGMIKEVNWGRSIVVINTTIEVVKNSPQYDDEESLNDADEQKLYDYYEASGKQ